MLLASVYMHFLPSGKICQGARSTGVIMFGLPLATTALVLGFPILWVAYTIGFLVVTRHWEEDSDSEDE